MHLDKVERYFTIEVSQEKYINEIAQYGMSTDATVDPAGTANATAQIPKSVPFEVRFITYDQANKAVNVTDNFVVTIFSNGAKSLSDASCDFSSV
jgi:predicted ABC-class ATPase